ncbi:MAG: ATP-binding cassette domain-containing protein, partial [Nitrososphaerota archaeon]
MSILLVVENLKKYFGGIKAVDNVSFTVKKKELVSIIGPNGAGKTTLVNLISGYLYPTDGKIIYNGIDIKNKTIFSRIRMGIIRSWQIPQLFESFTVREAIASSIFSRERKLYNIWRSAEYFKDYFQEADEIASLFNLNKDKSVKELSEGERKLLDIALSFSLRPQLLILDEPTSGVSAEEKFAIMNTIIETMLKEGVTLIAVEHDLE